MVPAMFSLQKWLFLKYLHRVFVCMLPHRVLPRRMVAHEGEEVTWKWKKKKCRWKLGNLCCSSTVL